MRRLRLNQSVSEEEDAMKIRYIYWQEEDLGLGYREEYPDSWTQGETRGEGILPRNWQAGISPLSARLPNWKGHEKPSPGRSGSPRIAAGEKKGPF